jgi:hypothetical protein
MKPVRVSPHLAIVIAFVTQVVVGSTLFFLLYAVAVGLALAINYVNQLTSAAAPWLRAASGYVEGGLFAADLLAFAMFILAEIVKFARALLKDGVGAHGAI